MATLMSPSRVKLSELLSEVRIVSVTNVPGLALARSKTFDALHSCFHTNPGAFEQSELKDGTKRAALATEARFQQIMDFEGSIAKVCPEFVLASEFFRGIISEVSRAFASSMDFGERDTTAPFMMALEKGQQLEHFIVYQSPVVELGNNETEAPMSIDLHVDEGLFIALVSPLLIAADTLNQSSLIVQIEGELRDVVFPDDSSVMFMVGDGLNRWMKTTKEFSAVPHAMKMPGSVLRLWYGRMFLPPPTQFNPQLGVSFGMYRQLVLQRSPLAMIGCLAEEAMRDAQCTSSELHCWMKCYSPADFPECDTAHPLVCVSKATGAPCEGSLAGCSPCCAAAPAEADEPFCDTTESMSMFMNGFASPGPGQGCIIFLFQGWVLDTKAKFALGCCVSIVLGIFAEWLISLRKGLPKWRRCHKRLKVIELGFYVVQACLAYILMLLAMTYSTPIFFCVLLGLLLGHILFVSRKPGPVSAREGATPCCEDAD